MTWIIRFIRPMERSHWRHPADEVSYFSLLLTLLNNLIVWII